MALYGIAVAEEHEVSASILGEIVNFGLYIHCNSLLVLLVRSAATSYYLPNTIYHGRIPLFNYSTTRMGECKPPRTSSETIFEHQ